ncbi:MAG: VWA domain-containing protein [Pirellulaceae bacterium]
MKPIGLKQIRRDRIQRTDRAGTIMVLSAFLLAALCVVVAFVLNASYIELAKCEMRLATDAASKAASIMLGQTGDEVVARTRAKQICQKHIVAGDRLRIRNIDVEFGQAVLQSDGSYDFTENATPYNAVKVNASFVRRAGESAALPAMGSFVGREDFELFQESIATRIDNDVCLVVDRSGSMAWDLTNVNFSYPGDLHGKSAIQNYFLPPHATLSRWAALDNAINEFLTVLDNNPYEPRVGLSSYSSNFEFGTYSSVVSTIDQPLTNDFSLIRSSLDTIASKPLIGNTNIAAGMRDGIAVLTTASGSRPNASRSLVLMTDGIMTQGDDPVAIAAAALADNITVHTITFSDQADQTLMAQVAAAGGGNHYHAPDGATLAEVFRTLAETLPAMLVQ